MPALASIFGIFLVRQYALSIPDELLEAARIDGAGELRIFRSIVLPLLKPIIVTLGVFTFLGDLERLHVAADRADRPAISTRCRSRSRALSREHVQDNELMMAGSVLTMLPVLLRVPRAAALLHRRALRRGSVKG